MLGHDGRKSICATLLVLCGLFGFSQVAHAQSTDGLFAVTFEVGFISRDIETGEISGGFPVTTTADSGRVLVILEFSPIPEVRLYVVGGGAGLDLNEFGFSADLDGMYGGGLTLTLYDVPLPDVALFLDGRYLRFVTDDVVVAGSPFFAPTNEEITWNEYRARIGVKARVTNTIEPYGGVEVSLIRGDDRLGAPVSTVFDIEEADAIGVFVGVRAMLDPQGRFSVFAEVNVIDEHAVRAGMTFAL